MELHQLRGFCQIVQERSFTRAAEKLFITQPAISLQIKALEEELGSALFERQHRKLGLTAAGEVLYRHAREILDQLDKARDEVASLQKELRGRLVLGTSDTNCTYILPQLLEEFGAKYPAVELAIRNKMSSEVVQLVLERQVDLGLATLPVRQRDLVCRPLFRRRDLLICPPDHPLATKKTVGLATVARHPLLVLERGSVTRQLMDEQFRRREVELQVAMNLGSIEVIKRFVEIGLGLALVPEVSVVNEVASKRLAAVQVRGLPPRSIGLVEHRTRRRSPVVEAFVELIEKRLGQTQ